MLRKCFLVPVLASLAFLMIAVDVAQAQRLTLRERRMQRRGMVMSNNNVVNPTNATMQTPAVQSSGIARVSYYPTPANQQGLTNVAQIRVILPDPQAKVFIDDKATTSVGQERLFVTPALQPGAPNTYRIRMTIMQNGQEVTRDQLVNCLPNTSYVVDFTNR